MDAYTQQEEKQNGRIQKYRLFLDIEKLGTSLFATQRAVSTAMMIAHKYHLVGCKGANDTILCVVSFLLSFKINDIHRSLDDILNVASRIFSFETSFGEGCALKTPSLSKIMTENVKECVLDQELLFCITTNFEFSYIDYYDYLFSKFYDLALIKRYAILRT